MFPSAFSLLKRSKDDDDPKPSYLGYVWMNLKVVEEDLIGAQSSQDFYPLGQPGAQVVLGEVEALHADCKLLLLLALSWFVIGDSQVVGGFITFVLHYGN